MAYEFHYTPTGTGVISGKEVLEQTEDAINDLGNTAISGVQEALDKAEQALTNSENAVDDAQTALNTANNAEGVAIQAQTDVGNLSGTVTNIGNRVTTAEGNITNLQGRMTTAEGNITNLQGRMTTAETNIGNLQTAVSTAQATANSAQQTATTARQQSYVFRYSGTAVVPNSTIAYSTIDNTDNIKAGDKILDVDGKLFEITAVDTTNQTVTVGSALVDLALDANVVHTSGNETIGGVKSFINYFLGKDLSGQTVDLNDCVDAYGGAIRYYYAVSNYTNISNKPENKPFILESKTLRYVSSVDYIYYQKIYTADYNTPPSIYTRYYRSGSSSWSNWVKDTDKFVTTDTAQTISAVKTFTSSPLIYNSDTTASIPQIILKNQKVVKSSTTETGAQLIYFTDKNNNALGQIETRVVSNGITGINITSFGLDSDNQNISSGVQILRSPTTANFAPNADNAVTCGRTLAKWSDVQTYKVNNLTPSSLSLPDIANKIDISSYITNLSNVNNEYTPSVNGWICIRSGNATKIGILDSATSIGNTSISNTATYLTLMTPVIANRKVYINVVCTSLDHAYFIPCQGNV